MSVLMVRVLTSSRDASSRPDQSRRACSIASNWSKRVEVCHTIASLAAIEEQIFPRLVLAFLS